MAVKNYFAGNETGLVDLGGGIRRKVTAHSDNLMCVEVHFDTGAVGAMHSHPHEQITYILSGRFEFTIGDTVKVLTVGDSTFKQPHIEHGAVCLEAGVLLDIFTPCRQEFLGSP